MIWQDYKKLYANALKTYSPKFKKELQRQVDTYCDTQDFDAISDKGIKDTIKKLHAAMGTRMAQIVQKDVKTSVKGQRLDFEVKSKETDFFAYVILTYLEARGLNQLAADITDTTKKQIQSFLDKSAEENLTLPETIKLLRTAGITNYRAELIARTETGRSANIGSMVGAMSTGLVTVKEWIAAKDNRTRRIPRDANDHLHMDGVKLPIDAKFEVRAKTYIDFMLHPADSTARAGNVCNCRCTLGYEAQRDTNGQLLKLENNPPKGDAGLLWSIMGNVLGQTIGSLISAAIQ